jgi:hypothetical protein
MPTSRSSLALAGMLGALVLCCAPAGATLHVLTTGKIARFGSMNDPTQSGGVVMIGRDPELRTLTDPRCPTTSSVEVEAYLQSTYRDAVLARVTLDCAHWTADGSGYRYADPNGSVRAITYRRTGMWLDLRGPGIAPITGPVGFLQTQLEIGGDILRARFHDFRRNDGQLVISRRPSASAAAGEAGFWTVLFGRDASEAQQQTVRAQLEDAVRRTPSDGRAQFLLAMLHLYRFGQRVTSFADIGTAAHDELAAANAAFARAVPLLWDDAHARGDSRVPGFAAAAKYMLGFVEHDDALRAAGLADLERAVAVNGFFNVFDFIPVLQALPPSDPVFQQAYASFVAYLSDPDNVRCVVTQPEICANAGFAPHNLQGSLTLFGDLYAKGGNLAQAQAWYGLASGIPGAAEWRFLPALQDRIANAPARVAQYMDADPANDPPVIGVGAEACANCHNQ